MTSGRASVLLAQPNDQREAAAPADNRHEKRQNSDPCAGRLLGVHCSYRDDQEPHRQESQAQGTGNRQLSRPARQSSLRRSGRSRWRWREARVEGHRSGVSVRRRSADPVQGLDLLSVVLPSLFRWRVRVLRLGRATCGLRLESLCHLAQPGLCVRRPRVRPLRGLLGKVYALAGRLSRFACLDLGVETLGDLG